MAEATPKTTTTSRQDRVQMAGEVIDRLDIARHLVMAEPINCRLALTLRILRQSVDDVADLAGACDERERRDRETIRQAAAPLPKHKRTILQRLDAAAFIGVAGLAVLGAAAWIGASVAIRAGWLSLAAAVVALPLLAGSAMAEEHREFATPAEHAASLVARCEAQGRALEPCMADWRARAAFALDHLASTSPRLVAVCEAEHSDPLDALWCVRQVLALLRDPP